VATLHDFHPVTLALAPLLGTVLSLEEGRNRRAFACAALALACREDIALQLAALLCLFAFQPGRRRLLPWAVPLLFYFFVYVLLIQPRFLPAEGSYGLHFSNIGGQTARSGRELLLLALAHPLTLLRHLCTAERLLYPVRLLWPVAFLPLLRPGYLIGAVPIVAINLLSDFPRVRTIEAHYTTAIVPFVIAAAITGAGRLRERLGAAPLPVALLLACVTVAHIGHGGSPLAVSSQRYRSTHFRDGPNGHSLRAQVAAVPPEASVAARPGPLAHVATRPRIISPPEYDDGQPVDVVVRGEPGYP
jgi:uncharacterized membrane protein